MMCEPLRFFPQGLFSFPAIALFEFSFQYPPLNSEKHPLPSPCWPNQMHFEYMAKSRYFMLTEHFSVLL